MPTNKESYTWSPQSFLRWAKQIGSATANVIDAVLNSKPYPEHSYKACFGILSLAKTHSRKLLEQVCKESSPLDRINRTVIEQAITRVKLQNNE